VLDLRAADRKVILDTPAVQIGTEPRPVPGPCVSVVQCELRNMRTTVCSSDVETTTGFTVSSRLKQAEVGLVRLAELFVVCVMLDQFDIKVLLQTLYVQFLVRTQERLRIFEGLVLKEE
jgi:hypothetical protein